MADTKDKKDAASAKKDGSHGKKDGAQVSERDLLLKSIKEMEHQNKALLGQIENNSEEKVAELKTQNKELKAVIVKVQQTLAAEIVQRKIPLDATGLSDTLQVFKAEVLAYCADRKLDPGLWKKFESL